ncbi:leucine carboxyl methyltransferase [Backusella circina FSU 941]|nr:leucine carboxyl methyltransferase [Backusella circina FSU 941]
MNFMDNETNDDIVRGTNDDATVSRLSAVKLGYFNDPFVHLFVRQPVRRSPIINRGSFIRSYAIDTLVKQFLSLSSPNKKKQIVALGAGFDTRYFTIKAGLLGEYKDPLCYYEVDFPEITMKKAMTIKKRKELNQYVDGPVKIERGGMDLKSSNYCLIGGDLRDWNDIAKRLMDSGLDVDAPTLFLSECVLIYLAPQDSSTILQWITDTMTNTMFTLYEQIKPDDAFGRMMLKNLSQRNIDLKGIHAFPDLEHQADRFKAWDDAMAVDINTIHDKYLNREEVARIGRLEILDEWEEWRLLSAHYCVAWAYKSRDMKDTFREVGLK